MKTYEKDKKKRLTKSKTTKTDYVEVTIKKHKDKNGGHYHVIVDNVDNKHVSVGLTTKTKKGNSGGNNYAMEKSPFDDGKKSFMRRQGTVADKSEYSWRRKGTLTPKDYNQARVYGERAKEKYVKDHKKSNDSAKHNVFRRAKQSPKKGH